MPPKNDTYTPDTRGDLSIGGFSMIIIGPCLAAAVIVQFSFVENLLREYVGVHDKNGAMQILFIPLLGITAFLTRKRE